MGEKLSRPSINQHTVEKLLLPNCWRGGSKKWSRCQLQSVTEPVGLGTRPHARYAVTHTLPARPPESVVIVSTCRERAFVLFFRLLSFLSLITSSPAARQQTRPSDCDATASNEPQIAISDRCVSARIRISNRKQRVGPEQVEDGIN